MAKEKENSEQKVEENRRGNHAWNTCDGGVRGLVYSAEKIKELAEKRHKKNYWRIGALVGGGIAAIVSGLLYFTSPLAPPNPEIIVENPEKEEIKVETPFNVVDTYRGISWFDFNGAYNLLAIDGLKEKVEGWFDSSLGTDSLLGIDDLIENVMNDFCFVSASDDMKITCLENYCLKYETKPNKTYNKKTSEVIVSFEKECVTEELKEIVDNDLSDIKDVRVEFDEGYTPRLILKLKKGEPNLIIDKYEEEIFDNTIAELQVLDELEKIESVIGKTMGKITRDNEETSYQKRTRTVSEVLSDSNFFIDLIIGLEVQLELNLGDEINSEQLEKARIEFRYVEYLTPYGFTWMKIDNDTTDEDTYYDGITDEYMYDDETIYRLIAIDFYFKRFQSDDEQRISIPASRFDYNNGPAFLIKKIAEYDPNGDVYKPKLNAEEVYPFTYSFFPDECENNPTRVVTRTFMAFEADTKEIIIKHNPTLSTEENTSLMMQLADAFRTPLEFIFLLYKEMNNKEILKLLYKQTTHTKIE